MNIKNTITRYWVATRPWSFPVSITPVLLTTFYLLVNGYSCNLGMAAWAIVGIVLFHAAGNMLSDYFDYKHHIDTTPSPGGSCLPSGLMTPKQLLTYGLVVLALACLNGIGLMIVSGWQLLLFGIPGALLAIGYGWMKSHALGDLDILLNFGILPTLGTAYVLTGDILWDSLWATPLFATITVAVLHANNTRDAGNDNNASIRTFAMLIGPRASQWVYYIEVCLPIVWMVVCVLTHHLPWWSLITAAMTAVVVVRNIRVMASFSRGGKIDMLDQMTAQLQMANMVLLWASCFAGIIL